ncbi:saccharopine dehydrogenase NADP-binding domain-containing protein [bacterium]|nr:saccharopine dehydrogenase NADP-binding domain-containing protein [candidate division CSSED10-310 bacterium]
MKHRFTYAVIGSGMQGTAEAYDLARFGDASRIYMADINKNLAENSAQRVNKLVKRDVAKGVCLDAKNRSDVLKLLNQCDTCCAAAHYTLNFQLTELAIESGTHFCDLGGNTGVVLRQHELSGKAVDRDVSVVPDCGLAPGLGNVLAARAISEFRCDSVQIRCGGLPQDPKPPLGYKIVFSPAGLTNEYTGICTEIRDGDIVEVPAFTELESISFPEPVGNCEAFLTSGGTSTGPWSFLGKTQNYGYKTVRYPGHYSLVKAMIDLGLLDTEPLDVKGLSIVPRDLFHELISSKLQFQDDKDLVVLRVTANGKNDNGLSVRLIQEMIDFQDNDTGFSAMERTTAYPAAIVAIMMTNREIPSGVHALENVVDGRVMIKELAKRGIDISVNIQTG